ncbi:MAG: hypothetical protein ACRC2H_06780, partial [Silanimonas sp.]
MAIVDPFKPQTNGAGTGIVDPFKAPRATLQRPAPQPAAEPSSILRRTLGDSAVDLGRGVVGVGEAVVGLGNLATFGGAGKALEAVGYAPQRAKDFIGEAYSPERQLANQKVQDAEGFVDT